MDDIVFLRPVEIGSIITFTAEVVFSSSLSQTALVNVEAVVEDPASGNRSLTNEFNFEFSFNELQHQIYPESYFDAMKFISGRRTFHSMSAPEIY